MEGDHMRKIYFHGSNVIIKQPSFDKSRNDIDFGKGFYLTLNEKIAKRWASNKKGQAIINCYNLDLNGLKIFDFNKLEMNKNDKLGLWFEYIRYNRSSGNYGLKFNDSKYDVIIGPIADDRLFPTINMYNNGMITKEKAIEYMLKMKLSNQIVLKTEKALNNLSFVKSISLTNEEKKGLYLENEKEKKIVNDSVKKDQEEYIKKNKTNNIEINLEDFE